MMYIKMQYIYILIQIPLRLHNPQLVNYPSLKEEAYEKARQT